MAEKNFTPSELYEAWPILSTEERVEGFEYLQRNDADDFFLQLSARDRAELVLALPVGERRLWMRLLAPDDAADLIQEAPPDEREGLLALLDDSTRREVKGLLDYAEDEAGGLMNTRYSRLRADMTVGEAISYLRRDARARERAMALASQLNLIPLYAQSISISFAPQLSNLAFDAYGLPELENAFFSGAGG